MSSDDKWRYTKDFFREYPWAILMLLSPILYAILVILLMTWAKSQGLLGS